MHGRKHLFYIQLPTNKCNMIISIQYKLFKKACRKIQVYFGKYKAYVYIVQA